MEYGSGGGGYGGDDDLFSDQKKRKKRYHRHTAHQIQKLEAMFTECPHPDDKQRMQLSRELGLAPLQIKFWFQNRRTQMKTQHERADNCSLRAENDKIRFENIAIREALKNLICPSCGGPPLNEDSYFDEQKLRMENSQLKQELDRVSSIAAKYMGRPISQLPPVHPIHISSLELSMGNFGTSGPSLDLDPLPGTSLTGRSLPFQSIGLSDEDKSLMADIAAHSMEELIGLAQSNEPLWMKSSTHGKDILNLENYYRIFPKPTVRLKNPHLRIEASRDSGVVIMNSLTLVDMFMDSNKTMELFPGIISSARTMEVISSGLLGSHSGTLLLMHEELQVLSPLVPTREFYFLRYYQQINQGLWAICNVSYDFPAENRFGSQFQSRRLPSGCLIQDMPNDHSKVIWVEHVEIEDKNPPHRLYRDLFYGGIAFGAERWVATLQRMCERFASSMAAANSARELEGVIFSPDGKRSTMKLAQRMINNFCASISTSNGHRWTTLSEQNEVGVRVTVHKSNNPGQPNGVVLSAATTIRLPVSPQDVFDFFRDERTRSQWDVLSDGNVIQEVAHIANGSHPGNCISILRALNTSQNNMLILQESSTDSSGSMVVYCPVDLPAINIAMSGEDPSHIPLLPSGFVISPDGRAEQSPSTSSGQSGGSLITVAFQILMSSLPSGKLNLESVTTVNNLIGTTVQQIKTALNCPSTLSIRESERERESFSL